MNHEPDIDPQMLNHFEERDVFYMNPICWFATVLIPEAVIALLWIFR